MWCDNIEANSLSENVVFHTHTKDIKVDVHFIREKVASKAIDVRYVPTNNQSADILTKPLTSERFEYLKNKLALASPTSSLRGHVKQITEVSS